MLGLLVRGSFVLGVSHCRQLSWSRQPHCWAVSLPGGSRRVAEPPVPRLAPGVLSAGAGGCQPGKSRLGQVAGGWLWRQGALWAP